MSKSHKERTLGLIAERSGPVNTLRTLLIVVLTLLFARADGEFDEGIVSWVGYGLLSTLIASLIVVLFARRATRSSED